MKRFLDLRLSGDKIFPYFLWSYLVYWGLMIVIINFNSNIQLIANGLLSPDAVGVVDVVVLVSFSLLYSIVVLLASFFIYKEVVTSLYYNDEALRFEGRFGEFFKTAIIGSALTAITCGIYYPWLLKKINGYLVKSTSYNNLKYQFKGSAVILLAIIYIPLIIYMGVFFVLAKFSADNQMAVAIAFMVTVILYVGIFSYLYYRWHINLIYNGAAIKMRKGRVFQGLLNQILHCMHALLTLGLTLPIYYIYTTKFFVSEIENSDDSGNTISPLSYHGSIMKDFFYILGQQLLATITLGIYIPWAAANISRRLINKIALTEQ